MFTDGAEGAELVLLSPAAAPPGLRLFLGSRFVAEVPDSPASTNSATTTASSDAAGWVLLVVIAASFRIKAFLLTLSSPEESSRKATLSWGNVDYSPSDRWCVTRSGIGWCGFQLRAAAAKPSLSCGSTRL